MANGEVPQLLEKINSIDALADMFDEKDVKFLNRAAVQIEVPEMLCSSEWDIFEFSNKSVCVLNLFVQI